MNALLEDEEEADEEFWNQDAFAEVRMHVQARETIGTPFLLCVSRRVMIFDHASTHCS
jgi:hypothetical protein